MSAHTPGPWRAWDEDIDGDGFQHCDWPHVLSEDGSAVCDLCDWGSLDIEEQVANARLIAAAPDLLKACAAALAGYPGWQKMIEAAYTEATGGKP